MGLPFLIVYGGGDEGGAVEYLQHLLTNLDRSKFRPIFVSLGRDTLSERIRVLDVEYLSVSSPRDVAHIVRSRKAQFLHTHGVRANFAGRLAAVRTKLPSITTIHSMISLDYVRSPMRMAATAMDNMTLPFVSRVIAISEAIAHDAIARGVSPEHIRVVYNGIPAAPESDRAAVRAELGIADDTLALVTAARLHPVKGLHYLIEAAAALPSSMPKWHLFIAGDGPLREALVEQANQLGLADRVTFMGYLQGVRRLLPAFDLYVSPSLMEGLGLSVMEAMAAALPIVATGVGGVPELITHEKTGILIPPGDATSLCAAIIRVLADPLAAVSLATAAEQRFRESFTVERFTRATEDVYREVLVLSDGQAPQRWR